MKKLKEFLLCLSVLLLSFGCNNAAQLSVGAGDDLGNARAVASDTPYFEIKAGSSASWSQSGKFQFQIAKSVSSGKTVSFDFVPPSGTTSVTIRGATTDTKWINSKSLSSFTKSGNWYTASFTTTSSDSSIGVTFYTSGNSTSQYVRIANLKIASSTAETSTSIFKPYASSPSALSVSYVKPTSGGSGSGSSTTVDYVKISTSSSTSWSQTGKFQFQLKKSVSNGQAVTFKFVPPANTTSVTIRGVDSGTKFISEKALSSFTKSGDWYTASFTASASDSAIGFTFYVSSKSTSQTVKIADFKIAGTKVSDGTLAGGFAPYSSSPAVINATASNGETPVKPEEPVDPVDPVTPSTNSPIKWCGIRCSDSSSDEVTDLSNGSTWGSYCKKINNRFSDVGARRAAIWIVNEIHDEKSKNPRVEMFFPSSEKIDYVEFTSDDKSEAFLTYADQNDIDVWLQVMPGNVDVYTLEKLVLNRYKNHKSVKGFGLDIEWYKGDRTNKNNSNYYGSQVTDDDAKKLVQTARAINPNYTVFLKQFGLKVMPPTYREGLVFVNDSQGFDNLEDARSEFREWIDKYPNNPVFFQLGYENDESTVWGKMKDPVREFGLGITNGVSTSRQVGIIWVDFTLMDVLKLY